MKICVFNAKGGVGKTTLTLNLAGYFAQQDPSARVLVADCDPQACALGWAALADETPFTVGRSRSRGFDIELMDMPPTKPANNVLPAADLFLIPTQLNAISFASFLDSLALLKERQVRYLIVANMVNRRRAEHRDRLQDPVLENVLKVHDRAHLASSFALGKTVFEMTGAHVRAAQDEIAAIARAIQATPLNGTHAP